MHVNLYKRKSGWPEISFKPVSAMRFNSARHSVPDADWIDPAHDDCSVRPERYFFDDAPRMQTRAKRSLEPGKHARPSHWVPGLPWVRVPHGKDSSLPARWKSGGCLSGSRHARGQPEYKAKLPRLPRLAGRSVVDFSKSDPYFHYNLTRTGFKEAPV